MTSPHNDWHELQTVWQSQAIDLPKLQQQTRWKTRRMRLWVALEFAMVPLLWWYSWWMWPKAGSVLKGWLLLWCLLAPLLTWWWWHLRRGTWRAPGASLHDLLALKRKRLQVAERMAFHSWWMLIVCAFLIVIVAIARWYDGELAGKSAAFRAGYWVGVSVSLVWLCLWLVGVYFYRKKKRRQLQEIDKLISELDADSEPRGS